MISVITRLIVTLCGLCTTLIGVTLFTGTLRLTPTHISFFSSNNCALPCVYGIVPGITNRNNAMQKLQSADISYTYFNEQGMKYTTYQTESMTTRLAYLNFASAGGANVSSLQLYQMGSEHDLGSLSDFLLMGYQPTQVFSSCQEKNRLIIALDNPGLFVQVAYSTQLDPNTPVMAVSTAVDETAMTRALQTFACATRTNWLGYAAPWKYAVAPQ